MCDMSHAFVDFNTVPVYNQNVDDTEVTFDV